MAGRATWLVWLGAIVAAAGTARLGLWQLDRADQKIRIEREITARAQMPSLPASALARRAEDVPAQRHRHVEVHGQWLSAATVALDNRPSNGRAGFIITTPLLLAPGDAVLVQRGWVPRDPHDRARLPAFETPSGRVRIEARIADWPSPRLALAGPEHGAIRQNLDPVQLARETGVSLRPLSLLQLDAADTYGLVRQWSPPAQDVWKHRGYALQWFAFSALIVGLTLWYRVIRPLREQRS